MCGISGFISQDGRGPHLETLKKIVLACEARRGGHAVGLAWIDKNNELHHWKRAGEFATNNGADIDMVEDALAVVAHARYATHGDVKVNDNNHPHRAGRGWIVHNGVVHNYRELAHQYKLPMQTACDSEVLGHMICHWPGSLADRAKWAAEQTSGPLAIMGLWTNPVRLLIVKSGNPLVFSRVKRGYYLSSVTDGIPGVIKTVPDDFVDVLRYPAIYGKTATDTASMREASA